MATVDPIITELAIIRQARNITQRQAATKAGLTGEAISLWENGRKAPTLTSLRRYVAALGVDLAIIRPGDDVTRPHDMGTEQLADALRTLAGEAADRLAELVEVDDPYDDEPTVPGRPS